MRTSNDKQKTRERIARGLSHFLSDVPVVAESPVKQAIIIPSRTALDYMPVGRRMSARF
jgi:hypothetical protein